MTTTCSTVENHNTRTVVERTGPVLSIYVDRQIVSQTVIPNGTPETTVQRAMEKMAAGSPYRWMR